MQFWLQTLRVHRYKHLPRLEADSAMVDDANIRAGQCHCGAVKFEATLSDGFNTIRRCTCSYCRMRGAVAVSAAMGGIRFSQGEDALTSYRFNTGSAQHFFCSHCGIYTHHHTANGPFGFSDPFLRGARARQLVPDGRKSASIRTARDQTIVVCYHRTATGPDTQADRGRIGCAAEPAGAHPSRLAGDQRSRACNPRRKNHAD